MQPQQDSQRPTFEGLSGRGSNSNRGDGPTAADVAAGAAADAGVARKPYQFLLVHVLRQYLALEFTIETPFEFDVERLYDDFGMLRWPDASLGCSLA